MKKLFFAITLLVSCFLKSKAQSILTTQSFDSVTFAPSGWAIKQPVLANPVWVRRTDGRNGTAIVCNTHSGAGLARYSSRATTNGYTQNLVTQRVDYVNRGTLPANISFWMYRDTALIANVDSMTVYINTTDSLDINAVRLGAVARHKSISLPDTQAVSGWYLYSFTVPATFNTATNYFIFKGTSHTAIVNQGANIFIDDVSYLEYPPICSGIPNVGSVIAPTLLCNGGGITNISLSTSIANAGGITYNWQQASNANGPWTSFSTAGNTASASLTSNTFIQCVASCSYSGLTYTTPTSSVNVSADTLPIVSFIATPQTICVGASSDIKASGSVNYAWAPAVQFSSTAGDSVNVAPTTTTQYTVTATNASGCSTVTGINIIVSNGPNANITAFPNDSVCNGVLVVLNSVQGNTNGLTYAWSDGVTTRRDSVTLNASTSYSVTVTNAAGCTRTATIFITLMPDVVSGFTYSLAGGSKTVLCTDASSNGTAYTWYFGNGDSSNVQSPSVTYATGGTYNITQVVKGFCGADTTIKTIILTPESLENKVVASVNIYPNPASNNILYCETSALSNSTQVVILDITGKKLITQLLKPNTKNAIDISTLSKGIYTLLINGNATKITKQ
jgi:hypothetical protein